MKKLLDKWISISLIKRIIGGLALGIILGLLVPRASGIALFGSFQKEEKEGRRHGKREDADFTHTGGK